MITPIEIRQHTFKKGFRGFDPDEVTAFMNVLSHEWENVLGELRNTKNELEKTKSSLEDLRKVENVLHKTLLQAEQTSKSTIENAKKNAELKVFEADTKSKGILDQAQKTKVKIQREIDDLLLQRAEILNQMKMFLHSQQDRLKSFESIEMKSLKPEREEVFVSNSPKSFFEDDLIPQKEDLLSDEIADQL